VAGIALKKFVSSGLGLGYLTGPIFAKELRVASRRPRSYVLRFAYLAALGGFIVLIWGDLMGFRVSGNPAFIISRMAEAGKSFAVTVVRFQFWALHLLAVAFMSNSIREETQRRTLGILMTTPITGWQIVFGKLLSKLLPLGMLMALILPVLAVTRFLGGVPWSFVISSLCITATGLVLVGSITLRRSLRAKDPFSAAASALAIYGFLFLWLPRALYSPWRSNILNTMALHTSPLVAMQFTYRQLAAPLSLAGPFSWKVHCLVVLGISFLVLALTARKVRAVGLMCLQQGSGRRRRGRRASAPAVQLRGARGALRRVHGSPLIWKELRFFVPGPRWKTIMGVCAIVCVLIATYAANLNTIDFHWAQIFYIFLFFGAGAVVTAALAGGTISAERESRALPLLLSLPIGDNQIVLAKALGVLYRAGPAWLLVIAHVTIFTAAGYLHPIFALHAGMLIVCLSVFLTGAGLYFSSRFASGTSAATLNVIMSLAIWAVLPLLVRFLPYEYRSEAIDLVQWTNPAVQLNAAAQGASEGAAGGAALGELAFPLGRPPIGAGQITAMLAVSTLGYTAVGLLFAWRAKRRLRRHIFEGGR